MKERQNLRALENSNYNIMINQVQAQAMQKSFNVQYGYGHGCSVCRHIHFALEQNRFLLRFAFHNNNNNIGWTQKKKFFNF